ncbi:MAG: hypothetical protein IT180_15735 [Acidobacteria bacterium]|nr:hypothetical protein [Acidobacteriota bacterium]
MRPAVAAFVVAGLLTGGLVWLSVSLAPDPPPRWSVTRRVSAHRALVLEVDAMFPEEALDIARQLGEPEQPRFDEILVFIYRPGSRVMARRVQWTRAHGFVEDVY